MSENSKSSRRDFLKKSAAITGAAAVGLSSMRVHAAEGGPIKIGLLGCGGRGCGAVMHALKFVPNVQLVAVADIVKAKADGGVKAIRDEFPDSVTVTPETTFIGFDSYKSVIPLCDVVFHCTPQHFRPMTMKAGIEAGKHAFCEKPVAVDATGIRSIFESAELAKKKGLNIVTGLVNRYSPRVRECVKRIQDGQIGAVTTARSERMNPLWMRERVAGETEMQYQMKNWVNFNWMTGEYINDVSVHQLDVALWCMGDDVTPVSAYGLCGRIMRTGPGAGDMLDTMSVVYEYADGKPLYSFSCSIPGAYSSGSAQINGTKGKAEIGNVGWGTVRLLGENAYDLPKEQTDPYLIQHSRLFDAIRGKTEYVNDLPYTAKATMTAIMGRMASYTGRKITWDDALNSPEDLRLKEYSWDATPPTLPDANGNYALATPGRG